MKQLLNVEAAWLPMRVEVGFISLGVVIEGLVDEHSRFSQRARDVKGHNGQGAYTHHRNAEEYRGKKLVKTCHGIGPWNGVAAQARPGTQMNNDFKRDDDCLGAIREANQAGMSEQRR